MTSTRVSGYIETGISVRLYVMDCPNCHITFGITTDLEDKRRKDGESLHCPIGHRMSWTKGKSDEQKLRDSQAREQALQDQLSAAIRDADATRVALLRDRARFAAGVCPCCNRSFENVRRHMATKHPDYDVRQIHHERVALAFKCSCGRSFNTLTGLRTHQGHQRRSVGSWRWDKPEQDPWDAHLTVVSV